MLPAFTQAWTLATGAEWPACTITSSPFASVKPSAVISGSESSDMCQSAAMHRAAHGARHGSKFENSIFEVRGGPVIPAAMKSFHFLVTLAFSAALHADVTLSPIIGS